ncbi:MAG: phosphate ABC transporter substrate-binding protein [Candidatus Dadabacteria bacterium]|nr:phosphate ABC transporter substrate-binding protein [Candidatus Dadabacteria bacterium]MDE0520068.1 phosphate ABC transporter substrate-binding protein [Candidatus Dadabacteria bacterium]MDE0663121.1 phosphate ABC transporter substrate-binding protein [Candidatus Dadabacteria bacterium]
MKNFSVTSCFTLFAIVYTLASGSVAGAQTVKVDPSIPFYAKATGVSGNIDSVGSDTMNNLMTFWCEGFSKFYPNVRCQIEGKGSSTAPPALIAGTSQFGPMSRMMKSKEIDAFEKETGYKPTAVPTSIDALAVYVNKDNPIGCLSIKQVDAIFSKNRKCGGGSDISIWGAAGLGGDWSGKPISVYGRNSASGTYGYFKKKALCKGDYKDTVKEQPGSSAVVQGITEDLQGIGYSGIGYKTSGVKAIEIAKTAEKGCFGPSIENVVGKKYPLGRYLYLYVNKKPNEALDPLRLEFLKYILSQEGQEIVIKDGYLPLTAGKASELRDLIGAN